MEVSQSNPQLGSHITSFAFQMVSIPVVAVGKSLIIPRLLKNLFIGLNYYAPSPTFRKLAGSGMLHSQWNFGHGPLTTPKVFSI